LPFVLLLQAQLCEASIDWFVKAQLHLRQSKEDFDWSPVMSTLAVPELAAEDFLLGSGW
jgi:hypothetical protein